MDWKGVGSIIGKAAPIIGGLLGGPAGASAGSLVANVLGVKETPEAVSEALTANPEALAKVQEAQLKYKTRLAEIALEEKELMVDLEKAEIEAGSEAIKNVNATMQKESEIKHPWAGAWRPFWGFASAVAFFIAVMGIIIIVGRAVWEGDWDSLAHMPSLCSSLAMLFSVPGAILGVASWHRGKKQRIEAGEVGQSGIMGAIANRIKR